MSSKESKKRAKDVLLMLDLGLILFKQFSLALVHSLSVKTFLFQGIQFSQTVLIQTTQFSIQNSSISDNSV